MVSRSGDPLPVGRAAARGLRLVGLDEPGKTPDRRNPAENPPWTARRAARAALAARELDARRAVARENVEASIERSLDPRDPRWQVALQTATELQGSLLSFERRRRVLAFAARVGVRPFDANLIIAAVQDRARRGEHTDAAMPIVALTAAPRPTRWRRLRRWTTWWPYAAAVALAIGVHALLAIWLLG